MKTDYIYDMPAGKEMDTLVAEKVMGLCAHDWKLISNDDDGVCRICQKCHLEFWGLRPPVYGAHYGSYSTDISAAWEVVEKLSQTYGVEVSLYDKLASCKILKEVKNDWKYELIAEQIYESTPLAICRSALLAVTYKLE